jgi:alpha-L-fucosidase
MIDYEKYGIKTYGALPNERQMEWFKRERSIFFHFGMNTFTDKEWGDGTESPELFNPTDCDVDSWVKAIFEAGFTLAILTAKHHDGFCLWQTKYTEHSIKNSPYKNGKGDIVKEFTDACQKYGVKAGIYLSPWDRHEKTWGTDAYNDFYVGQLTELLTNYGKIFECWWDGAGSTEAVYDWERWAKTVHTYAPDAVIFGSLGATPWVDVRWVGNEKGIAGEPCYSTIDASSLIYEYTNELNSGKPNGNRFIPAEADVSIRPGWFYHESQDNLVRTPENLMELYYASVGRGCGLLLNIPPNRKGQLGENDVKSILGFNALLDKYFEKNLLTSAKVCTSTQINGTPSILDDGFFAPAEGDALPTLTIKLPEKTEINTIMIGEAIELGQKITKICVSATVDGEKTELFSSQSVGYKLIKSFDAVTTDEITVEILESLDTPVLDKIGAYMVNVSKESEKKRAEISAKTKKIDEKTLEIELGGIFTFDTIYADWFTEQKYKLYLFNGTDYDLVKENLASGYFLVKLDEPSDGAYRVKLEFEKDAPSDVTFILE